MSLCNRSNTIRKPTRISGLSLIEVLIALAVLSIGLVGMAALHLNSLQNAHSSYYRSIASTMALEYEERLWLAVADSNLNGCPDADVIATELENDWNQADSQMFNVPMVRIPNVEVTPGDFSDEPDGFWRELPITVTWAEDRFAGENDEAFIYSIRILCKP